MEHEALDQVRQQYDFSIRLFDDLMWFFHGQAYSHRIRNPSCDSFHRRRHHLGNLCQIDQKRSHILSILGPRDLTEPALPHISWM